MDRRRERDSRSEEQAQRPEREVHEPSAGSDPRGRRLDRCWPVAGDHCRRIAACRAALHPPGREQDRSPDQPRDPGQQAGHGHGRESAAPASTRAVAKAQQVAAARQIKTGQDALKGGITKAGGRVTGQYQYAYNGIKVRISGKGVPALAALPGVTAVHGVTTYTREEHRERALHRRALGLDGPRRHGKGQTIAVIDSGIDYTHANFGGPGTAAAYDANNSTIVEPGSFPTTKVIAGWDFAGNGYDAEGEDGSPTPAPTLTRSTAASVTARTSPARPRATAS